MSFHASFPWLKPSAFKEEPVLLYSADVAIGDRLLCLLNGSVPFYLPIPYHRSTALNVTSKDSGKLFAHAAQLIIHSEAHEVGFWKAIDQVLAKRGSRLPIHSGFLDEQLKLEVFGNGALEECRNANEYIFEPRILMQLPYFPAIFHQWLCAFSVQWFHQRKKLDFLHLKLYPASCLPAVTELMKFVHNADRFICCGYSILGLLIRNYPNRNQELIQFIKENFVPRIGYFKDFFEKRDFLDVVCVSLRIFVYKKYGSETLVSLSVSEEFADDVNIMKIINYYQGSFLKQGMFDNKEMTLSKVKRLLKFATSDNIVPFYDVKSLLRKVRDIGSHEYYVTFLKEHLLETKILRGITMNDIRIGATVQSVVDKIEDHELKKSHFTEQNLHAGSTASALCSILIIEQMQSDMSEIVGRMYQCQLTRGKHVEFNLAMNLFVKFSLHDSICIMKEATSKPDFKQNDLIEKVKAKFIFDNYKKDLGTRGYFDKIADEFIERINRLAVAVLETNAKQDGLQFEGQRNLLWIQYILPCFVSSLLRARKMQKFKTENLKRLAEFINHFIGQFEADLNEPIAKDALDYGVENNVDHIEALNILWQEVIFEVHVYILDRFTPEASFDGIPGFNELEKMFTNFLYSLHEDFVEVGKSWALRQQWFLKRILKSVRALEMNSAKDNSKGLLKVHNYFAAVLYKCVKLPRIPYWLLCHVHKKILSLKRKQPIKGVDKNIAALKRQAITEAENLSLRKTLGIVLYELTELSKNKQILALDKNGTDAETNEFLELFSSQDWASLRVFLLPIFNGQARNDLSLLDLSQLKDLMIAEGIRKRIINDRVIMKYPGEVTMLPVKHCRWCGNIGTKRRLKMCHWCSEFKDYPDVTWFCSVNCEKNCNTYIHEKEHEKFIISLISF